uniref:Uncharacterized protein n=2 Tax=Anguilla anguilla TaxID=7936 RepID=A0A0E9Q0N3_ANGAN
MVINYILLGLMAVGFHSTRHWFPSYLNDS